MRTKEVAVAATLVVGIASLLILGAAPSVEGHVLRDSTSKVGAPAAEVVLLPEIHEGALNAARTTVSPGRIIRVVDEQTGQPLADATVAATASLPRRCLARDQLLGVSQTDSLGCVPLDLEGITVVIRKKGYLPSALTIDKSTPLTVDVRLGPGSQLDAFVTKRGSPLSNTLVLLSMLHVEPSQLPDDDWIPGPNPRDAVYSAKTDDVGVARFLDLPQGTYVAAIASTELAWLPDLSWTGFPVPGPAIHLDLASPVGLALAVKDDVILAFRMDITGGAPLIEYGNGVLQRAGARLRELYPQCATTVVFANDLSKAKCRIVLLLKNAGEHDLTAELRDIADITEPITIVVPPNAARAPRLAKVRVRISGDDKVPIHGCKLQLDLQGQSAKRGPLSTAFAFEVESGADAVLPLGKYQLAIAEEPVVSAALRQSVGDLEIALDGQAIEIGLPYTWYKSEVHVGGSEGIAIPWALVGLRTVVGALRVRDFVISGGSRKIYLPTTACEWNVGAPGRPRAAKVLDLTTKPTLIDFQLDPK